MNIPPFMSILTDPFELIDVKDKSRPAPRYCSDPVMQTWSLAFHLSVFSLKDRLICSVQSRQVGLFCTFPNYLPLGFITPSVWPRAQTGHSAPLLLCVLALFRLSRRFGQAWSSLARSLCTLRKAAKWHPGGNQKHALASLSLLLEMVWDHIQFLALCQLQANTQAHMKARREIKEWVLSFVFCLGCSFNHWSPEGAHRTFDPLLPQCGGPAQV